jgi:hypothetical protein
MSMVALLQAVRHRLRDALTLKDSECDIGTDGQPHARAGERFLMVHPGPITNGQTECIDEYYSVKVTITRRLTYAPADRAEQPLVVLTGSLYELAAQARAALHMNYDVLEACGGTFNADEELAWTGGHPFSLADTVNGFIEPLVYKSTGVPMEKGPDWFWADAEDVRAPSGVALEMTFDGCRRVQTIESMS